MGAHTCSHTIKAKTKAEAVKAARTYQEQEQYENGHGAYSGHLGTAGVGVIDCPKEFTSETEALEWIFENHHDKWSLPMLAKCGDGVWVLAGWCAS